MQKIVAAVVILFTMLGSPSAFAQATPPSEASRKAELAAAWQAAENAGRGGPNDVALIDQATLKLPANYFFVPKAEAARVLRALGNVISDSTLVGLVVGTHQNDQWVVVIRYIKEGYIKEDARLLNDQGYLLPRRSLLITYAMAVRQQDLAKDPRVAGRAHGSGRHIRRLSKVARGGCVHSAASTTPATILATTYLVR